MTNEMTLAFFCDPSFRQRKAANKHYEVTEFAHLPVYRSCLNSSHQAEYGEDVDIYKALSRRSTNTFVISKPLTSGSHDCHMTL